MPVIDINSNIKSELMDEMKRLNVTKKSDILKPDSDDSAIQSGDDHSIDENVKSSENSASSSDAESNTKSPTPEDEGKIDSENLFTVKISPPGGKTFDVQVSPQEIVQELHHLLMDHDTTCHRTCFSLQLNGSKLDNFSELKSVADLQNGCEIKVVEENYSLREVKLHLRHVRDLLKSLDYESAYQGSEGQSLSYVNLVTKGELAEENVGFWYENSNPSSPNSPKSNQSPERTLQKNEAKDLEEKITNGHSHNNILKQAMRPSLKSNGVMLKIPDVADYKPPDWLLPGAKMPSLKHMHVKQEPIKGKQCIKILTQSMWNPPPSHRKLQGDLMYIYVVTQENKQFEITASTKGFFVNKSDMDTFNPASEEYSYPFHSIIDLLMDISPTFKTNFPLLNKMRCARHLFERVGAPFQLHSWTSPIREHCVDHVNAEAVLSNQRSVDENIPGQFSRDWNEEMAATRELSKKSLTERLLRERAMFKVHSDFVAAATRGAVMVIDGNIMAINPGDDKNMQMFIWNNIFFSLGFDVRDHYKDLGGDYAAYYAPVADLGGLRAYQAVDPDGIHTLGTIVVDYRGYRVTAQSIIPGILEKEQEQSIVYGSIDFGKTVLGNKSYDDLLDKIAKPLRQLKHSVINQTSDDNKKVEVQTSVECKGIIGNDGRHYILDLLRTFPPDANYLPEAAGELLESSTKHGFPKTHKHSIPSLRPELVEAFAEYKYVGFMQSCATQILALKALTVKKTDGLTKFLSSSGVAPEEKLIAEESLKDNKSSDNVYLKRNNTENEQSENENNKEEIETNSESKIELDDNYEMKIKEDSFEITTKNPSDNRNEEKSNQNKTKDVNEINEEPEKPKNCKSNDSWHHEVVRQAAIKHGSCCPDEFDLRFNPDIFAKGVRLADSDDEIKKQQHLTKEAAAYLVAHVIPNYVRECEDHLMIPIDGQSLTDGMHDRGINMRYLGFLISIISNSTHSPYFKRVCVLELITRCTKHLFCKYMQSVPQISVASAVAHFLNCLLCGFKSPAPVASDLENKLTKMRTSRKKKKNRRHKEVAEIKSEWNKLQPSTLWNQINEEANDYYHYDLLVSSVEDMIEKYNIQKMALLRSTCIKNGIQIAARDYDMDSRQKSCFHEQDILDIYPTAKHVPPRAGDAYHFFSSGQLKLQQGMLKDGIELISESLGLFNNVYGVMHSEIGTCFRTIARINYITGETAEAVSNQQKATIMFERIFGIDHITTISAYSALAIYCFANSQIVTALRLFYRARYLLIVAYGDDHPEMAQINCNIGLVLHAFQNYDLSLQFLEEALRVFLLMGKQNLKTALSYHLVARTYSCKGNFREALNKEKETFKLYQTLLGDNHEKTKESAEFLRHLTQQAVSLQRTMNEIYKKGSTIPSIPPLQIIPPSLNSVLDLINALNGIIPIIKSKATEKASSSK